MKRSKFMIGALVLSMGLLGTGYAYWTDALQVSTSVSTGNLELNFVEATDDREVEFLENMGGTGDYQPAYINNKDEEPSIKINNRNEMELKVSNMYPGTHVEFPYEVHNESTIPMILEGVNVTKQIIDPAFNNLEVMIKREVVDGEAVDGNFMHIGKGETLQDKLVSAFTQAYETVTPNFNKTIDSIVITAPAGLDEETLPEKSNLEISLGFQWIQANATSIK